jgi:hypothetical protein
MRYLFYPEVEMILALGQIAILDECAKRNCTRFSDTVIPPIPRYKPRTSDVYRRRRR